MKRALKIIGIVLATFVVIIAIAATVYYVKLSNKSKENMALLGEEAQMLSQDGIQFRDLNKNGKLDIYEDTRANLEDRVDNLVSQMTVEEKAGSMFVTMIGMTSKGEPMETPIITSDPLTMMFSFILPSNSEMVAKKLMNSFNIISSFEADILARYNNNLQKMAERTRLGIPVTIASDPRHGVENNPGTAIFTPAFSQWPGSLGLAATRDTQLVREFGDIARQEYNAVGIRLALHPMADLATEPRWGRANGTFGEDAHLSAMMTKAYVLGFQGDSLNANSVACMTKHFSGGGPQMNGEDAHFPYGREQVYPGDNFAYHVIPFTEGAFPAKTAQIMPYYGIPVGQTDEDVAFGFNKAVITNLLRDSLKFEGVVCTDWGLITDSRSGEARAWGVEQLSELERVKKVIEAGCDQFGGEAVPGMIVELVKTGQLTEERINASVKRIMKDKFILGLFDDPYVDEAKAAQIAGKQEFVNKGKEAQRKSVVLLKNENILPLKSGTKVYAHNWFAPEVINNFGTLVDNPDEADVIVVRVSTPFDPRSEFLLERFFHQGRLYFNEEELAGILPLLNKKPSIVITNLERPAILTEMDEVASAMIGEFGTSEDILSEILFGKVNPSGKLPFELPSSWEAVQNQFEDVPYDSQDPLYQFGHGLTYEK
ncbi:MAG: glycoside hydrolase family 3 C-terminal domain-containing protein [Bacteroidetes bacterium]|nr:glycoside hydrolase family 3 C-terminal domain-containing protein [Bacteroidota bacterium]